MNPTGFSKVGFNQDSGCSEVLGNVFSFVIGIADHADADTSARISLYP